jgi:hypothetical protein
MVDGKLTEEKQSLWRQTTLVQISCFLLISCVALGKLVDLSVP